MFLEIRDIQKKLLYNDSRVQVLKGVNMRVEQGISACCWDPAAAGEAPC